MGSIWCAASPGLPGAGRQCYLLRAPGGEGLSVACVSAPWEVVATRIGSAIEVAPWRPELSCRLSLR